MMEDISSSNNIIIEEIDSNEVPVTELSEFQETNPLQVVSILPDEEAEDIEMELVQPHTAQSEEDEGHMIRQFLVGESGFPDIYTKLEPHEEFDDELFEEEENDYNAEENTKSEEEIYGGGLNNLPQTMSKECSSLDVNKKREKNQSEKNMPSTSRARRRPQLNAALQGLMGQANLCFARGEIQMAEKICYEIIRQNPLAAEPFLTLAEIYENRDTEKFLNFLTIAVHLRPSDSYQWIRIAEIHIAQGNLQRARIYYTRAIKEHESNYDLRLRKARLLEMMGLKRKAMFTYLRMLPYCAREAQELCLVTAKNVAKYFHDLNNYAHAFTAMKTAYTLCDDIFTLEDLNLYMELAILNKQYMSVLACLKEHTKIELDIEEDDQSNNIVLCSIPDDYVPDFRVKLCVALIHLKSNHLLGYLIQNIHHHIPPFETDCLNLYCDVAEALMQQHKYVETTNLLRPIVDGDFIDCPAFVWLRQAECLRHLNRSNEAIECYFKVVEMAPFCYEAKFTLSALLKQQGRHLEAIKALEQSGEQEGQPLHARLLYERCIMLKQVNKIDECLEIGYVMLSRQSIKYRTREELMVAAGGGAFYNLEGLKSILQMRNVIGEDAEKALETSRTANNTESDHLSVNEEYQLFLELIRVGFEHKRFSKLQRLCFSLTTTKRFLRFHSELERIIILTCYFNNDCTLAFSYLRDLLNKNTSKTALWNLFGLLIQKGQDLRYQRYIRRFIGRTPTAKQMRIFIGHYHLHCSSYKYALNIYAPMFKEQPSALLALCITGIFLQLSLQKKVLRKCAAATQAVAFAQKYAQLRMGTFSSPENCAAYQEINYNLGRLYHQASLFHLAAEYYERALSFSHPMLESNKNILSLQQETAYNLHLIYKSSGNYRKAQQCLYQYCEI